MDAEQWNARYAAAELVWSAEPNRFVAEIVDSLGVAPGSSLEVACGEGRNAIWLARQGWTSAGNDFSDVAVDKARRLAAAAGVDVDLSVVDAVHGDLGGPYDLVLIAYLHLPEADLVAALHKAAAAVAPGGSLVVVGHDRSNLDGGYGGPQDADVLTSPELVEGALGGLGDAVFEVVRSEVAERAVETAEGPRVAFDTIVTARRR